MNSNMNTWEALAFASQDHNQGARITVNGRRARVVARTIQYLDTETTVSTARPNDGRKYVRSNRLGHTQVNLG